MQLTVFLDACKNMFLQGELPLWHSYSALICSGAIFCRIYSVCNINRSNARYMSERDCYLSSSATFSHLNQHFIHVKPAGQSSSAIYPEGLCVIPLGVICLSILIFFVKGDISCFLWLSVSVTLNVMKGQKLEVSDSICKNAPCKTKGRVSDCSDCFVCKITFTAVSFAHVHKWPIIS